ncbi:hypothetical protein CRM22_000629 [Opisthorchis felineus]|uniref:Uncharacterized protein n=1 Tax=Opisthorchis felineus TaxID=147828 RepID=A0A4S2ME52_OPIFE|nr:hypothetical protein CRM22_000629 [Opisthorchis felineus]
MLRRLSCIRVCDEEAFEFGIVPRVRQRRILEQVLLNLLLIRSDTFAGVHLKPQIWMANMECDDDIVDKLEGLQPMLDGLLFSPCRNSIQCYEEQILLSLSVSAKPQHRTSYCIQIPGPNYLDQREAKEEFGSQR